MKQVETQENSQFNFWQGTQKNSKLIWTYQKKALDSIIVV